MKPSAWLNELFGLLAKSRAEKEVFDPLSTNDVDFYRLAMQMDRSNRDVVGENCVRNDAGEVALSDDDKMKLWVEHYARLLNIEFEWPSHELPEVLPTAGPRPKVSASLISKALGKMKCGKSAGLSVVVAEMLKAAGDDGVELIRQLAEAVFSSGDIPEDWEKSFILNLHKGKGDALDRGNYRGLKLTDQVMKPLERTLDFCIRKMVDINENAVRFCARKRHHRRHLHRPPDAREAPSRKQAPSTSPLLTWKRPSTACQGRCYGGP